MDKTLFEFHEDWILVLATAPLAESMSWLVRWGIWVVLSLEFSSLARSVEGHSLSTVSTIDNCSCKLVLVHITISLMHEMCLENGGLIGSLVFTQFN